MRVTTKHKRAPSFNLLKSGRKSCCYGPTTYQIKILVFLQGTPWLSIPSSHEDSWAFTTSVCNHFRLRFGATSEKNKIWQQTVAVAHGTKEENISSRVAIIPTTKFAHRLLPTRFTLKSIRNYANVLHCWSTEGGKRRKKKELLRLLLSAETRWRTTSGSRCFVEPKADWRAIYTC